MTRTLIISLLGLTLAAGMAMANCSSEGCGGSGCQTMDSDLEAVTTAPPPAICSLTAFSRETNYMSLPGYTRWQQHQTIQRWLPATTIAREVKAQLKLCPLAPRGIRQTVSADKGSIPPIR